MPRGDVGAAAVSALSAKVSRFLAIGPHSVGSRPLTALESHQLTLLWNAERLRRARQMRDAIDRYKDAADRGAFQTKLDSRGYPPDLETLVKGVDSNGKKLRFLRKIPTDPMTGKDEWGLRSVQDDPDSDSWGGQNVFDIYTKAEGTSLDGTKYKTW